MRCINQLQLQLQLLQLLLQLQLLQLLQLQLLQLLLLQLLQLQLQLLLLLLHMVRVTGAILKFLDFLSMEPVKQGTQNFPHKLLRCVLASRLKIHPQRLG